MDQSNCEKYKGISALLPTKIILKETLVTVSQQKMLFRLAVTTSLPDSLTICKLGINIIIGMTTTVYQRIGGIAYQTV